MATTPAPGGGGSAQWWVVWTASFTAVKNLSHTYHVAQLDTPPADGAKFDGYTVIEVQGPYATQAAAEAAIGAKGTTGQGGLTVNPDPSSPQANQAPALPSWSLALSGISGWFMRGLKILFGGVLMILGISHLTGLENKLTQAAGKVAPIAAVAA